MEDLTSARLARENLLYIRKTLEAAGQVTAVPGKCLIAVGLLAIAGAVVNGFWTGAPWSPRSDTHWALVTWGFVLAASVVIVSLGIHRKSRLISAPIQPPLLRKLLWSLSPALFVGGLLTHLAVRSGRLDWLPVIWLGCYGAAITNGGQVSVAPVRYMGLSFLATAGAAALSPSEWGLAWLVLGFGWLHLAYGAYIARRHNG